MKPLDKGTYFYLPILQRSIDKANAIIERFMTKIDAHKITIPNLTPVSFWKDSGLTFFLFNWIERHWWRTKYHWMITLESIVGRLDEHESELLLLHEKNDWPQLLGPVRFCVLKNAEGDQKFHFKFLNGTSFRPSKKQSHIWWALDMLSAKSNYHFGCIRWVWFKSTMCLVHTCPLPIGSIFLRIGMSTVWRPESPWTTETVQRLKRSNLMLLSVAGLVCTKQDFSWSKWFRQLSFSVSQLNQMTRVYFEWSWFAATDCRRWNSLISLIHSEL